MYNLHFFGELMFCVGSECGFFLSYFLTDTLLNFLMKQLSNLKTTDFIIDFLILTSCDYQIINKI